MSNEKNIDIQELKKTYKITESLAKLDEDLIGLDSVKQRITEITAILFMDKIRQDFGLSKYYPGLHMSFTGSPGTGKSTVASRMSELLQNLGYLTRGHLIVASRDDLVAQFVGQTAPKTKEVLEKAMGGVLLIDEAYYLYKPNNEKDYGGEAIEMLLQVMENKRTDLVLIFAGYSEPMKTFYRSNPGLSSRVAHHIDFPDYSREELIQIAQKLFQERQYQMTFYAQEVFIKYLDLRRQLPLFANARSIKNIVNRACFRLASRVMTQTSTFTYKSLIDINASDLILSTLFLKGLRIFPMTKIKSFEENGENRYIFQAFNSANTTLDAESYFDSNTVGKQLPLFTWKSFV
uniref:Rubisco expression protein n=1 Tax=Eustigmatophyceae sp. Mont 10/10-1w TaxID=2506145 RepID=A0A3R5U9M9_9STRA|nr:Rubisco expression protein [Eustigmatophyceae sp. Mont 10/10-1w]QAA11699.1 Rubisco expression protein [Eustigmatophyceae sp. Mont 10/10-1w]